MSGGWREDSFIIVSLADLLHIPEFVSACKGVEAETTTISVSEEQAGYLKSEGLEISVDLGKEDDTRFYWKRTGIPLNIIKKFMVDYLEANDKKHFEMLYVPHRTIEGKAVTTERYSMLHKNSKFVERELFDELNEMQNTSMVGR